MDLINRQVLAHNANKPASWKDYFFQDERPLQGS